MLMRLLERVRVVARWWTADCEDVEEEERAIAGDCESSEVAVEVKRSMFMDVCVMSRKEKKEGSVNVNVKSGEMDG